MKYHEKIKAIRLRKTGRSIKDIARELFVSKSSVSTWVRDIKLTDDMLKKLKAKQHSVSVIEKRRQARLTNESLKRSVLMTLAGNDIRRISYEKLKIIGAMLYWAEGGKTKRFPRFSNSDPDVIRVMMQFFRIVCKVEEGKLRVHLHIHSHLKVLEAERYWSGITKIPLSQFIKTYAKPSIASKFKKDTLPYGTIDVYICDVKMFLKIMGWIKKIGDLVQKM